MNADAASVLSPPELIAWAAECLEESGVFKPRLNAELLLAHCTGQSRTELYAYPDRPIPASSSECFMAAVQRRVAHEPLQYITGKSGFRYLELEVDRRVLIPRPETEMLAEKAVRMLRAAPGHPLAVDMGTGSGCIALSLARECPAAVVYATDISPDALAVARVNAARLALEGVVSFRRGDLCRALDAELAGKIDLMVCNPPYIKESDFSSLPPEVRENEPYSSLVAGPEGTEVHLRLMRQALSWLAPSGRLLMEAGEDQVDGLARAACAMGYEEAEIHSDLTGRPRILEMALRHDPRC